MKINDKVLATWPNGWTLRGTVLMVLTVIGKPIQYCVQFSDGSHHVFEEGQVKEKS